MTETAPAAGSRADFDSLIPWARHLFAHGAGPADVMRAIYGVGLPQEFYVLAQAEAAGLGDELPYHPMVHPWQLLVVADPAATPYTGDRWARRQEERAFAQYPDFLPVLQLAAITEPRYNRYIVGYDLAALRAGTVLVLGHRGDFPQTGAELRPVGDSLLGMIHVIAVDDLEIRRAQLEDPRNFGFGSIGDEQVDEAVEQLQRVAALLRGDGNCPSTDQR
ncbi:MULTISPECIES: hypothetical protein [unclassified Streptomyces]|uniref:hypothetical protein n=1 Tax=unclassified Streptomyces TaxID=2593676 RepID=UPI0036523B3F